MKRTRAATATASAPTAKKTREAAAAATEWDAAAVKTEIDAALKAWKQAEEFEEQAKKEMEAAIAHWTRAEQQQLRAVPRAATTAPAQPRTATAPADHMHHPSLPDTQEDRDAWEVLMAALM